MIHRDTEDLAESKLILLYILSEINAPVSKNRITQIVLENNLMNYFSMQQFLTELVHSKLIMCREEMGKHLYSIKQEGLRTFGLFSARIPLRLKETLYKYLKEKGELSEKEAKAHSNYYRNDNDTFTAVLGLTRGDAPILEIKLITDTEKDAEYMCSNWNANAKTLYPDLFRLLLRNKKS